MSEHTSPSPTNSNGPYYFYAYEGYILVRQPDMIGIGLQKFGGESNVLHWLPTRYVGRIVYKVRRQSEDFFVNEPLEAIELPEWLAKERKVG